jgi:hypothetical protein
MLSMALGSGQKTDKEKDVENSLPDFEDLRAGLYDLPPGLYDIVREFVLLPGPEVAGEVIFRQGQEIPSVLQINQDSRQASSARYYNKRTFEFVPDPTE